MIKEFSIAGVVAAGMCALGYFELLPAAISAGISVCAFVVAAVVVIEERLVSINSNIDWEGRELRTLLKKKGDEQILSLNNNVKELASHQAKQNDIFQNFLKVRTAEIQKSIGDSTKALSEKLTEVGDSLGTLKAIPEKVDEFVANTKEEIKAQKKVANKIEEAIDEFGNHINALGDTNTRMGTALKDGIEESMEATRAAIKDAMEKQSDTLETKTDETIESIKSLTKDMRNFLEVIKVSVEEVQKTVKGISSAKADIDKADKELLKKINEICR